MSWKSSDNISLELSVKKDRKIFHSGAKLIGSDSDIKEVAMSWMLL